MILKSLGFERRETVDPKNPRDAGLAALFGIGARSASGVHVTPDSSLRSVAVFSCVRVVSETVGSLPLITYQRMPNDGKERATKHRCYRLLKRRPNRFQTPSEWKQMMQGHVCLRGNGYSEIIATGSNPTAELIPLHPDRVRPFWAPDGLRAYDYQPPNGKSRVILQSEMFHLMGYSSDGLKGLAPIELARNAVGLEIAQEEVAGYQIQNGVRPAGILKMANKLDDDGRKNLRNSWQDVQAGAQNAGKIAILEEGLEWEQIGMSSIDAQFLEQRKFSTAQIARLFRVPPHMIGDLERSTNNNIEQQALEFVKFTMLPWFVKWEEAISRDLLLESEEEKFYAEFLLEALERADITSRYNAFTKGRFGGWLSVNDIRRADNMNPIDNGDAYLTPLNMTPTGGEDADEILAKLKEMLNGK